VKFVAEKLADIKRMSYQEIAIATSSNADSLFGWSRFSVSNKSVL
jgi:Tat protein secretion system quality control protein TatD with DNase activity